MTEIINQQNILFTISSLPLLSTYLFFSCSNQCFELFKSLLSNFNSREKLQFIMTLLSDITEVSFEDIIYISNFWKGIHVLSHEIVLIKCLPSLSYAILLFCTGSQWNRVSKKLINTCTCTLIHVHVALPEFLYT